MSIKTDSWKRPLPSAVDDCANVTCGYEQQLEFVFKPNDATPEQVQEWYDTELKWWADKQFTIIWIACGVQISALAFMGAIMLLNGYLFS